MQIAFDLIVREKHPLAHGGSTRAAQPFKRQLLKWVGNKQRFAHQIVGFFPDRFKTYYEPFVGSGAVVATLAPRRAEASDAFGPLIQIWRQLRQNPAILARWYEERWVRAHLGDPRAGYEDIKSDYNREPNGADLLYLCRSCYGGVVRFRQKDGYMSTPCGPHRAMHPNDFTQRVEEWSARLTGTEFFHRDYREAIDRVRDGDVVYCDPPYTHSQAILYGAQAFNLDDLFRSIELAKRRGAFIALSIDGSKKSGENELHIDWPRTVFTREVRVNVGRSMLRRLQMDGQTLEAEHVTDRLLLSH